MNFSFSKTEREYNEDRCFSCEDFAFVIDGATGISNQKFSKMNTDAEWYADWWYNYLKISLKNFNLSIYEILKNGMDLMLDEFKNLAKDNIILDYPSATLDIVRKLKNNQVEIYVIGDSPLLIQSDTGHTILITDNLNIINDDIKIATFEYYSKKENLSFIDSIKKHYEIMFEHRALKNKLFGYNILSDDKDAILRGIYKKIDGNIFKKFILTTDGYSQLFDLFNLYTPQEFANSLNSIDDAKKLYQELFNAQELDSNIKNYLRIKHRDDASVCVLDISK